MGDATMTLRTRLTEKLRIEHPVLLAVLKADRGAGEAPKRSAMPIWRLAV